MTIRIRTEGGYLAIASDANHHFLTLNRSLAMTFDNKDDAMAEITWCIQHEPTLPAGTYRLVDHRGEMIK